ncbi:hypothetical protein EVAR_68474_1 [Eumeta japonica]|uniref:Uncharacterized protein n=1 Tax=Eumeta variegata TaxID=151549 RepID=A0A4C2A5X2_EUMVA|nr:hypothetical protein EVAR_68474_1 [Eumeta japonica]
MKDAHTAHFRSLAEIGNSDPWDLAYRAASGRKRAPRNVLNGIELSEVFVNSVDGAIMGMLKALCPNDDPGRDTAYHRFVRISATTCLSERMHCPSLVGRWRTQSGAC